MTKLNTEYMMIKLNYEYFHCACYRIMFSVNDYSWTIGPVLKW